MGINKVCINLAQAYRSGLSIDQEFMYKLGLCILVRAVLIRAVGIDQYCVGHGGSIDQGCPDRTEVTAAQCMKLLKTPLDFYLLNKDKLPSALVFTDHR